MFQPTTQPQVSFQVNMENPASHYFNVTMEIKNSSDEETELSMPVWTPGSYLVREFSKNIDQLTAKDENGNLLPLKKSEKNTWIVKNAKSNMIISYQYYAFEESVRTSFLDDNHASIIPASLFLYLPKYDVPVKITFHPFKDWKQISTALEIADNNKWIRTAQNRDQLFDSPIEIGNHTIETFTAEGVQHEIAMVGIGNFDLKKIKEDFIKIIHEEVKMFGEHPSPHYTVIIQNTQNGGGGLEHKNSTSLMVKRFSYESENTYRNFLELFSHEYFHLWNVKRLRPIELGPFDYTTENYTRSIWIAEGFTEYYDDLMLRRAGILNNREYLNFVEGNLTSIDNRPGSGVQSVADASFDAWIKYYRPNENSQNSQSDYYNKGASLGLILDLLILHNSNGKYRLDDVMRFMYDEYAIKLGRGYTEEEMKAGFEKFAAQNLDEFYKNFVYGTEKINYQQYFEYVGLILNDINSGIKEPDAGITVSASNIITQIRKGEVGEQAGLNVNDEIIAINGIRFSNNLSLFLTSKKKGDELSILVNRGGIMRTFTLKIGYNTKVNYHLILNPDATVQQKELYKKWISSESFN